MKRKTLATIIGTAGLIGLAASSYAQGTVFFNTYAAANYYPIVYGPGSGALTGTGALGNVDAELLYNIGGGAYQPVQDGSGGTAISIQAVNPNVSQQANGSGPVLTGWITGPIVTIPTYVSGAVNFEILAWVASGTGAGGGTFATSGFTGVLQWTETSIQGNGLPAGKFQDMPSDVILTPVPEPTTLALAGLGGLASLVMLRRKHA